jgi:hypothetical protein
MYNMLFGGRKGLSIGMITGIQASFDTKFVNGSGVGASSRSTHRAKSRRAYITPGAVSTIPPQPPTNIQVSLVNGAVQVSWTAPTSFGDSPISSYTITSSPGDIVNTTATTNTSFSGLTDGTTYTFTVVATNAAGNSSSVTSSSIVAYSLPSPPTSLSATPGNTSVSIGFTPPTNTGGVSITNYQYSINGGTSFSAFSPADATSPVSITGLTNGTPYTIQLKTVTSVGASSASSSVVTTPATTPDAPTSLSSTSSNTALSISFTPPTNTGGSAITNYQYSTDNGSSYIAFSPAVTTSPVSITGLTNGLSYSIKLRAVNSMGVGTASSTVTGTPATTPNAPTSLSGSAGNNSATVSFIPPIINGGASVTNYQYSIDGGTSFTAFSPADTTSPVTITGLTNGTPYTIQLKAVNSAGAGPASSSVTVTPIAFTPLAGSLLFDTGKYLTAASTTSPGLAVGSGAYTIECWFYNNNVWGTVSPNFNALLGCVVNSNSRGLNIEFVNDRTILTDYNAIGTRLTYSFGSAISLNEWHHFVLVRDSNKIESAFIDGVKATSSTGGTGQSGGQQTNSLDYSGKSDTIGRVYEGQWRGYITNFRVVAGTAMYVPTASSITIPIGPLTAVTGTQYLMLANDVTTDSAGINTITNVGGVTRSASIKPF